MYIYIYMNHFNLFKLTNYKNNTEQNFNENNLNELSLDKILKKLENDKSYHIKYDNNTKLKLFFDLDHIENEKIFNKCLLFLKNVFKVEDHEISYTTSKDKNNLLSYHVVIPKYYVNNLDEIKNFINNNKILKIQKLEKVFDSSIYRKNGILRMPNQTNEDKPNKHKICVGKMEDFIINYIDNSILYTFENKEISKTNNYKEEETTEEDNEDDIIEENNKNIFDENEEYLKLCISNKIFIKLEGYPIWFQIACIIKNCIKENKFYYFNEISKQMKGYGGETNTKNFFNDLLNRQDTDNILGIGTLKHIIKEINEKKYKIINFEFNKLMASRKSNNIELDETKFNFFDNIYFESLQTYELKKSYFEKFVIKVLRPSPFFIYSELQINIDELNKNDICNLGYTKSLLYSREKLLTAFENLKSGFKTKDDEDKQFITHWLKNEPKTYNNLIFKPYNGTKKEEDNIYSYNIFSGYDRRINTIYNKEQKEQILKPFKDLLFELVGGNQEYSNYFYKYIAHMIQKPQDKMNICIIMKGKQGVGKNLILNCISNIIGQQHFYSSSKASDFFSEHSGTNLQGKILININEMEIKDSFNFEGLLKSLITENKLTVNPKGLTAYEIDNFSRVVITSNKPNIIPIDIKSKDRRYVIFQATDKYISDKKYSNVFWSKLYEHFNNSKFISCLYDDLNEIDINKFDFIRNRPITEAYKEYIKLYVPNIALFLEDFILGLKSDCLNKEIKQSSTFLFSEYNIFLQSNGFIKSEEKINIKKFHSDLIELDVNITKHKNSEGCSEYRFNPTNILNKLVEKGFIMSDDKLREQDKIDFKLIDEEEQSFIDEYFINLD